MNMSMMQPPGVGHIPQRPQQQQPMSFNTSSHLPQTTSNHSSPATTAITPPHALVIHVRGERFILDRGMLESDGPNIFTRTTAPPTVFQRSPFLFTLVVDHLCGYPLPDPLPAPATRTALLADARFYGFQKLEQQLATPPVPSFFGEGKGFSGPVVEFADLLRGELPAGVTATPRRGIGRLDSSSMAMDRWLPVLIRATNLPVFFSLSLVESASSPNGYRYSTRFVLGLSGDQNAALRANFPETRAARAFQFNEFSGHQSSWPATSEPHLPGDGVAMLINGVAGTDAMVRAWARSISMRPYGEGLELEPLSDDGARRFIAQICSADVTPPPADIDQWPYWRQSRILWAKEVIFCVADGSSWAPSLLSVVGNTAMGYVLGTSAWGGTCEVPAMLPLPLCPWATGVFRSVAAHATGSVGSAATSTSTPSDAGK
ncbi:hypothetical protein BKA62DRAFT_704957 [Auriculariales sp. MPI-PUGE-AT-0066]|nr:hypothetical protein BKA62DRAFT_704957 [Auriculariales sp. MPI-PUGE-AT-0066]